MTNRDKVSLVPVDSIHIEKGFNVRISSRPSKVLLNSIKVNGVLNPLHVRVKDPSEGSYYLVDGHRRYTAATKLGIPRLPVVNHGVLNDSAALVISLATNEGQKKLTKAERFDGYTRLYRAGRTQLEIAECMAVSEETVRQAVKVIEHGAIAVKHSVKRSVTDRGISLRAGSQLVELPKREQRVVLEAIEGLTTNQQLSVVADVKSGSLRLGMSSTDKSGLVGLGGGEFLTRVPNLRKMNYRLADDAVGLCEEMEKLLTRKLSFSPNHKATKAQLMIIEVLRGRRQLSDLEQWGVDTPALEIGK